MQALLQHPGKWRKSGKSFELSISSLIQTKSQRAHAERERERARARARERKSPMRFRSDKYPFSPGRGFWKASFFPKFSFFSFLCLCAWLEVSAIDGSVVHTDVANALPSVDGEQSLSANSTVIVATLTPQSKAVPAFLLNESLH